MRERTDNHAARRARANAEPSPITALREMLATKYAADVDAATPLVCESLRNEIGALASSGRRDVVRNALVTIARNPLMPWVFARAFTAALERLGLEGDARQVVFNAYERMLASRQSLT